MHLFPVTSSIHVDHLQKLLKRWTGLEGSSVPRVAINNGSMAVGDLHDDYPCRAVQFLCKSTVDRDLFAHGVTHVFVPVPTSPIYTHAWLLMTILNEKPIVVLLTQCANQWNWVQAPILSYLLQDTLLEGYWDSQSFAFHVLDVWRVSGIDTRRMDPLMRCAVYHELTARHTQTVAPRNDSEESSPIWIHMLPKYMPHCFAKLRPEQWLGQTWRIQSISNMANHSFAPVSNSTSVVDSTTTTTTSNSSCRLSIPPVFVVVFIKGDSEQDTYCVPAKSFVATTTTTNNMECEYVLICADARSNYSKWEIVEPVRSMDQLQTYVVSGTQKDATKWDKEAWTLHELMFPSKLN